MIARVFPRRTKATPNDDYSFIGEVPLFMPEDITEVHVSCTFSYDKSYSEILAKSWERIAPVKLGGVAYGDRGKEFIKGRYIKEGYTITSRGCHNKCWFCDVWKREGNIRELQIVEGYNLLDSNILACSDDHIKKVFKMLKNQKQQAEFTGGLEAKILKDWHVNLLSDLNPKHMFFAYDTPDDKEPLYEAGKKLINADMSRNKLRCYVLIGYQSDTIEEAEKRLKSAWNFGFMPMAMLYKDKDGDTDYQWRKFQRLWARPAIIRSRLKRTVNRL
jgi:hypothetical protein